MKFWPWSRPEVRASESYSDLVVSRLLAAASGVGDSGSLAVVETACRWWSLGLSSATISPSSSALASITPSVLGSIGRALCFSGESLHAISVRGGRVSLTPVANWTVQGDADPESWMYLCNMNGPSTSRAITLPSAAVLNVRYAAHPARPWRGRSPLRMAADTGRAASLLEHATSEEFSFVQRQLLAPRRNQNDYGMVDSLSPDLIEKIVASFSSHTGSGAMIVPGDLEPRRLGPEPPPGFADLRDRLEQSILSLHGIPPALVAARGTGTALRESFRQILHSLLKPLGALVVEELREKLDPAAEISFSELRAGDIVGTSRALGSLVKAGLSPAAAAAIVGLDEDEVSA